MSAQNTPPPTPPAPPTTGVPAVPPLPNVAKSSPKKTAAPAPASAPTATPSAQGVTNTATPQNPTSPQSPPPTPTPTAAPAPAPPASAVTPAPVSPPTAASPSKAKNQVEAVPPSKQATQAETEAQAEAAQAQKVKKAQSNYYKAKFQKIFGRVRRHTAFFIVCGLFLYTNIWMFARSWQLEKAGLNENWFHEGLFLVLMVVALVIFYYRLYQKSDVYQKGLAQKEAAEKAARAARLKLEEEQKKQAFMGLIKDFQSASTYDQKSTTMAKLLTVGLESNLLRQQAVDLLCDLNEWMEAHKTFLKTQNLIVWRLKNALFEQSERFQVDSATQDLSIKSVNIIEAIIKKHITEFRAGRTKVELDLCHKTIPTLTLTAQTIPIGSLKLEGSNLWQSSFAETELTDISLAGCDLQGASFWRATLKNIDMQDAVLQFAKLRTNLSSVHNIDPKEFFATKEWELCYLSPEQEAKFFAESEDLPPGAKSNWNGAEPRRRKLYFGLLRNNAQTL